MEGLTGGDIVVLGLYFVVLLGMGFFSVRKIKDDESFAVADRSLSMKVMIGTTFATCMGAAAAIGNAGLTFQSGVSALWVLAAWHIGWITLVLISKELRASRALTLPDFLSQKYGDSTKAIASIVTVVFLLNGTAAQVAACGRITEALGLFGFKWGVIIIGGTILLYTLLGGLYSVAYLDVFHAILLIGAIVIYLPLKAYGLVGGFSGLLAKADPRMFNWGYFTPGALIAWIIAYAFAAGSHPAYIQRVLAAQDERTAFWGSIWSNLIAFLAGAAIIIACLTGPTIFPNMTNGEQFVPTMIFTYFPPIITGLVLAALLGVVISTADSFMLLLGTTISGDIYRVMKADISVEEGLRISRIATFCGGVVSIILAIYGSSVLRLFTMGAAAYGAGMFFPTMAAIYWKGATRRGANYGMLAGCFITVLWNLTLKQATGIDGVIVGAFSCLALLVSISLLLPEKSRKEITVGS